jgi:dihydrofolate reductase
MIDRRRRRSRPLFRAYLAVSLDGYIADRKGGVGWLDPYFTPQIDFQAFWRTIGAMVMGRATYDWTVAATLTLLVPAARRRPG